MSELEKILQKLIAIPSVTGNIPASKKITEYVSEYLAKSGITILSGSDNSYPYLVAHTRKSNPKTIWFVSHLDVVPAPDEMFRLKMDSENFFGRGVFDMKGIAAAILTAFRRFDNPSQLNVGFIFTTDEEVGGKNGVGHLVNNKFLGDAAFVFDQSSNWVLQERMKGVLWVQVKALGQAAHGARPWLGKSANHSLVHFLQEFHEWFTANIPQTAPSNYFTTYNVGTIHGGDATNQVAASSEATLDIRFVSEAQAQKITKALNRLSRNDITINILMHEPCVNTDTSEKWFQRTKQIAQVNGLPVDEEKGEKFGHGSTDGRFFEPLSIPVISTRPPGGGQHSNTEWVSKQGLYDLEQLVYEIMTQTIK